MSNASTIHIQRDSRLKEYSERILSKSAIPPSEAIRAFYLHMFLKGGMPFGLRSSYPSPIVVGFLTPDELNAKLMKGVKSLELGKGLSEDEVNETLSETFGI